MDSDGSSEYFPSSADSASSDDEGICSIDEIIQAVRDEGSKIKIENNDSSSGDKSSKEVVSCGKVTVPLDLVDNSSVTVPIDLSNTEFLIQNDDGSLIPLNFKVASSTGQMKTLSNKEKVDCESAIDKTDPSIILVPITNVENITNCERADEIGHENETDSTIVLENNNAGGKKERRSIRNMKEWKRKKAKENRMKGEAYIGYRRKNKNSTKVILQDVPREPRSMGLTCDSPNCAKWKSRLCNTISEDERKKLFDDFWKKMSMDTKRMFVVSTVKSMETKQKTKKVPGDTRRNMSFYYHLQINGEMVPVCQKMYLNTLGLSKNSVHYWMGNFRKNNMPSQSNVAQETRSDEEDGLFEHQRNRELRTSHLTTWVQKTSTLNAFFENLPMLPSHYCRKTTNKKYLQGDIKTWTQLYTLYLERCQELNQEHVSRYTFDRVRRINNVDIHQPKKDLCDTCVSFETKNISQEVYNEHIRRKEVARQQKEKDKAAAIRGECYTVCCDLMAVQTCPLIKASSAYYKLKLAVHNYTIYNLSSHDGFTYWFDETQTKMCASTFASCLTEYLSELLTTENKPIIVYSDGCNYQNRNSVLSNALLHLSVSKNVTIMQKYLEKGHTQMECDSVHSLVERRIGNSDVYLPSEFTVISRSARTIPKPYRAKIVDYSFFKNFAESMVYPSITPGRTSGDPTVTDLKVILYEPNGKISYKLKFEDKDFQQLPVRAKKFENFSSFPPLYQTRPKIPLDKFNDLKSLKQFMPSYAHEFYDKLEHEDNSRKDERNREKKRKRTTSPSPI